MKAFGMMLAGCLLATAVAQAETEDSKECSEAWLSHNWPSVAVRCTSDATNQFVSAASTAASIDVAREQGDAVDNNTQTLASLTFALAGIEEARAAYAYHILKKHEAHGLLNMATEWSAKAQSYATADDAGQVKKLVVLLQNPHFFSMKPDDMEALSP